MHQDVVSFPVLQVCLSYCKWQIEDWEQEYWSGPVSFPDHLLGGLGMRRSFSPGVDDAAVAMNWGWGGRGGVPIPILASLSSSSISSCSSRSSASCTSNDCITMLRSSAMLAILSPSERLPARWWWCWWTSGSNPMLLCGVMASVLAGSVVASSWTFIVLFLPPAASHTLAITLSEPWWKEACWIEWWTVSS